MATFESLEFRNFSLVVGDGHLLFDSVNLQLPVDETVVITGRSGVGKSAFVRVLGGLEIDYKGQFLVNGQDLKEMSFQEFLPWRLKIGFGFDLGGLIHNRTLIENLTLPLLYHNRVSSERQAQHLAAELLEDFGIGDEKYQRPAMVSGALRKAACVARTFVLNPELVVLDDPFVGLRPESTQGLLRTISRQREEGTLKHLFVAGSRGSLQGKISGHVLDLGAMSFESTERNAA